MPPVGLTSVLEETPSISPSGEQRLVLLEADDLGEQRQALVGIAQLAEFADAHAGHHGLEQGSGDLVTRLRIWIGRQPSMAWRIRTMRGERDAGMAGRFG